jgi:hypothetical protein
LIRYLLPLFLFIAASASAAVDPLGAGYKPSVDTNCSDAQYSTTSWMTDTGSKIRQDSGTNPGNSCYLSGSTQLYGTQNEFVDFQVHYRDSGSGTTGLQITVGNFVQSSPSSYTISSSTTVPPNVIVYREFYTDVTIKTGSSTSFYNSTGYYPDVLIPAVDPYWGQTTNAWPYTVAASNNQSAWVDVLIPSGAPAGYYLASVTVQTGCPGSCMTIATMPVVIAVWQWPSSGYMPSTATLKYVVPDGHWGYNAGCTQFYQPGTSSTTGCTAYPGYSTYGDPNITIWADGDLLAKDHRLGGGSQSDIYPTTSFTTYNTVAGPNLNGTKNYHGGSTSTCGSPLTTCPILPNSEVNTKQLEALSLSSTTWSNFQSNFTSQGWGTAGNPPLVYYLQDEPHSQSDFTTVYNNGSTTHGYTSPAVPNLVTTDIYLSQGSASAANTMSTTICGSNSCVLNVIDWIVTPINVFEPIGGPAQPTSAYTNWLGGSNPGGATRYWMGYQACGSAGTCSNGTTGNSTFTFPNYDIDGTPIANRVFEWITYFHGQTGELYYAWDVCAVPGNYSGCYPSGGSYGPTKGPWSDTYTFGGWGDGTLAYYGSVGAGNSSAENYLGASVTIPFILPSVRLKMIRDGIQDYEYMYKLNALGYSSEVNTQVDSEVTNSYTFGSWSTLQSARVALGNFMHALSYPASGTPTAPPRAGLLLAKH